MKVPLLCRCSTSYGSWRENAARATARFRPPDIHNQLGTRRQASITGCEIRGKRTRRPPDRSMLSPKICVPASSKIRSRSPGDTFGGTKNHGCGSEGTTMLVRDRNVLSGVWGDLGFRYNLRSVSRVAFATVQWCSLLRSTTALQPVLNPAILKASAAGAAVRR